MVDAIVLRAKYSFHPKMMLSKNYHFEKKNFNILD